MTEPTTQTTIALCPLPGLPLEEIPATAALADYVGRCQPGEPVAIVLYGRIRRPSGAPCPVLVRGHVFDGLTYGESAEASADHIVAIAEGWAADPGCLLADLAVDFIPARALDLADVEPEG